MNKQIAKKEEWEVRLNEYWNEHDGTNFYKDELRDFIRSEKELSRREGSKKLLMPDSSCSTPEWVACSKEEGRKEVIEKVREMIKKEMAHTSPCEHQTPKTETANDYNCTDIHTGRQEMGSDLLSSLNSLE